MPDNTRRARDEAFWRTFADRYDVQPGPVNLENGYFGRMSRTVIEEYQRNIELINTSNSVYVRQRFEPQLLRPPARPEQRAEVGAVALDRAAVRLEIGRLIRIAHAGHLTGASCGGNGRLT